MYVMLARHAFSDHLAATAATIAAAAIALSIAALAVLKTAGRCPSMSQHREKLENIGVLSAVSLSLSIFILLLLLVHARHAANVSERGGVVESARSQGAVITSDDARRMLRSSDGEFVSIDVLQDGDPLTVHHMHFRRQGDAAALYTSDAQGGRTVYSPAAPFR